MKISFEIPEEVAAVLREEGLNLEQEAREAFFLEQYRRGRLGVGWLEELFGMSSEETQAFLKERNIGPAIDLEEFRTGLEFLRKAGRDE